MLLCTEGVSKVSYIIESLSNSSEDTGAPILVKEYTLSASENIEANVPQSYASDSFFSNSALTNLFSHELESVEENHIDFDIVIYFEAFKRNQKKYLARKIFQQSLISFNKGQERVAIRSIIQSLHKQALSENLDFCDYIISYAHENMGFVPLTLHVSILMATLPFHVDSKIRESYFDDLYQYVENDLKKSAYPILSGLKFFGRQIKPKPSINNTF